MVPKNLWRWRFLIILRKKTILFIGFIFKNTQGTTGYQKIRMFVVFF